MPQPQKSIFKISHNFITCKYEIMLISHLDYFNNDNDMMHIKSCPARRTQDLSASFSHRFQRNCLRLQFDIHILSHYILHLPADIRLTFTYALVFKSMVLLQVCLVHRPNLYQLFLFKTLFIIQLSSTQLV